MRSAIGIHVVVHGLQQFQDFVAWRAEAYAQSAAFTTGVVDTNDFIGWCYKRAPACPWNRIREVGVVAAIGCFVCSGIYATGGIAVEAWDNEVLFVLRCDETFFCNRQRDRLEPFCIKGSQDSNIVNEVCGFYPHERILCIFLGLE